MLPWSKCSKQTASPELTTGKTKPSPTEKCPRRLRWHCPSCSPKFKLEKPGLHSGATSDRPEIIEIQQLPPIAEVVWQQPTEINTDRVNININKNNDSTIYYTQETSKTTVASQTLPPNGTQPRNYVVTTEHQPGSQTWNEPVPFPNCSKNCPA